jgi:hypothetical protein
MTSMVGDKRWISPGRLCHQDKEITEPKEAKAELQKWIDGLLRIYRLHHDQ